MRVGSEKLGGLGEPEPAGGSGTRTCMYLAGRPLSSSTFADAPAGRGGRGAGGGTGGIGPFGCGASEENHPRMRKAKCVPGYCTVGNGPTITATVVTSLTLIVR